MGYNPWGCKESDMTLQLTHTSSQVVCNYFLPFHRSPFLLSFAVQTLFSLMKSHLSIFAFLACILGIISEKCCQDQYQGAFPLMFSSVSFMDSGFMLKSLGHYELLFMSGII